MKDGDRYFPSTPGDIFYMIKSNRLDVNFQVARMLNVTFSLIAEVIEDSQGYKYLDNRDLIDFVDGTENPKDQERFDAVVSVEAPYEGGAILPYKNT